AAGMIDELFPEWKHDADRLTDDQIAARPARRTLFDRERYNTVVDRGGRWYEALVGVGDIDGAEKLANRLIELAPTGITYGRLIRHAARAGRPEVARKLVERAHKSLPANQQFSVDEAAALIGSASN